MPAILDEGLGVVVPTTTLFSSLMVLIIRACCFIHFAISVCMVLFLVRLTIRISRNLARDSTLVLLMNVLTGVDTLTSLQAIIFLWLVHLENVIKVILFTFRRVLIEIIRGGEKLHLDPLPNLYVLLRYMQDWRG